MNIKNKTNKFKLICTLSFLFVLNPSTAGGLEDATSAVEEIKTWAYAFLGVVVFIYLIYKVAMTLMDKETWADVLSALGKVALAGGVIVLGEWAWAIFGS